MAPPRFAPDYSKCIVLNGPPNSGKDTIARVISANHGFAHLENKTTLFDLALITVGCTEQEWFERYNNRELKEVPWDRAGGMSQRQLLIWLSEDVMKPKFGKDFFGKRSVTNALYAMEAGANGCVFSDGGFPEELEKMKEVFGASLLVVRLHREGCTFAGDSRAHFTAPGYNYLDVRQLEGDVQSSVRYISAYAGLLG